VCVVIKERVCVMGERECVSEKDRGNVGLKEREGECGSNTRPTELYCIRRVISSSQISIDALVLLVSFATCQ